MTAHDLLAAAILDARTCYAQFETYSTAELQRLQMVQQIEQAHATTPESLAFGGGRLALIAAVLKKRHVEPDPRD
jgi:hypothetical protein